VIAADRVLPLAVPFFSLLPLGPGTRVYERNLFSSSLWWVAFKDKNIDLGRRCAVNPHPNPLPVGEGSLVTVVLLNDLGAAALESQNRKFASLTRFRFSNQAYMAGEFMPKANFQASPSLT
jgi:hypothetical protein